MLQKEFEERVGVKVEPAEYKEIEKIYMECGSMDKDQFCDCWKHKNFYPILEEVMIEKTKSDAAYDMAIKQYNEYDKYVEEQKLKQAIFLLKKAEQYEDRELRRQAIDLIGERNVVVKKLELDMQIWEEDREYILNNL